MQQGHNERHKGFFGKIYKIISKIFHGDVDNLSQQVIKKIEKLEAPNINDELVKKVKPDKPVSFSVLNKVADQSDPVILGQANRLIEDFNQGAENFINEGLNFDEVQGLKESKKAAKALLKNPLASDKAKKAMQEVIKQYDQMVESTEVLSILRDVSRSLRNPPMVKDNYSGELKPDYSQAERFESLFQTSGIESRSPVADLAAAYGADKSKWAAKWGGIRKNMWAGAVESRGFLQQGKKITFITGSKSSTIPSILKVPTLAPALSTKPALIPTGQLLRHHIVPLAGELYMGISEQGVNQAALSGMRFAGLDTCISYAGEKQFQFNADGELKKIYSTKELGFIALPRLRVAVLRLLLTGEKTSEYPKIKKHLMKLIKKEPLSSPIKADWSGQSSLIGHACDLNPKLNGGEIQRGEIVAVPRTGSPDKFGIIAGKNPDGSYRVIIEKDGTMKSLAPEYITRLDNATLSKKANSTPPLSKEEQKALGESLENKREKVEGILSLFDTVQPLNYSKAELEMIKNPFPIVWASVSLSPENFSRGVKGEHIVRGKAGLGEDLQVVFTNRENIDKLKDQVKDQGVQVLSFEAAHFILGRGKGNNQYSNLWDWDDKS